MKYKNLKKNSSVDDHLDNLFMAVTDIFWSMRIDAGLSIAESRKLINRDVKMVIDESLRQYREDKIR